LDVDDEVCARFAGLLSRSERQHAARFHSAVHRRRYWVRRGILRELLAQYLDCPPREIPIAYTKFGKPYVPGSDVTFNLSHSNGTALYAFARHCELGCDIECRISRFATQKTAELILSTAELEAWQGLPERDRMNAFFDYWTCKEAYLKAVGVGFAVAPRDITVSLAGTPRFVALPMDNGVQWSLARAHMHPGYTAMLAMRGSAPNVPVREFASSVRGGAANAPNACEW
jgi:4'-phosphopantetheinyl transferase